MSKQALLINSFFYYTNIMKKKFHRYHMKSGKPTTHVYTYMYDNHDQRWSLHSLDLIVQQDNGEHGQTNGQTEGLMQEAWQHNALSALHGWNRWTWKQNISYELSVWRCNHFFGCHWYWWLSCCTPLLLLVGLYRKLLLRYHFHWMVMQYLNYKLYHSQWWFLLV